MDDLVERIAYRAYNDMRPDLTPSYPQCEALAKTALSAIQETHAIVPKEPTVPMVEAGLYWRSLNYETVKIYKAMIEASPRYE